MTMKKRLIPAVAAVLVLAGCGAAASGGVSGSAAAGGGTPAAATTPAAGSTAQHDSTAAVSSGDIPAGALPFPVAVGDTWVYRAASAATSSSTVTNKITAVLPTSAGTRVTESYSNSDDTKFDSNATWVFHSNGTITFPVTQNMGIQVVSSSGGMVFPTAAEVASGAPYHSTLTLTFAEGGKDYTESAHITMQGAGTQTVTVPAGTYQNATIVDSTFDATVEGIPFDMQMKFWVVTGVGEVKSQVSMGSAAMASSLELVSFTKG